MDMDSPDPEPVRCPTCRAVQPWSDACRRCRSDLRLLREAAGSYRRSRLACFAHLRDGHPAAARRAARRCHELSPSEETLRLMTVAAFLQGDRAAAATLARRLIRQQTP